MSIRSYPNTNALRETARHRESWYSSLHYIKYKKSLMGDMVLKKIPPCISHLVYSMILCKDDLGSFQLEFVKFQRSLDAKPEAHWNQWEANLLKCAFALGNMYRSNTFLFFTFNLARGIDFSKRLKWNITRSMSS